MRILLVNAQGADRFFGGASPVGRFVRQFEYDHGLVSIFAVDSAGTADPTTGIPNFEFGVRLDWHADFIRSALFH